MVVLKKEWSTTQQQKSHWCKSLVKTAAQKNKQQRKCNQEQNKSTTVFEIYRKKSHSTLRVKRATLTHWVDKSALKMARFWKPETCGQTVLPDRSILIEQKLVENAKIEKVSETFWVKFNKKKKEESFTFLLFSDSLLDRKCSTDSFSP